MHYVVLHFLNVLFLLLCCLFSIFVLVYRPLPPGGNPIAVNKYINISYRAIYEEEPPPLGASRQCLCLQLSFLHRKLLATSWSNKFLLFFSFLG